MGRERLASVSFFAGMRSNVGLTSSPVFVTRSSRHSGVEVAEVEVNGVSSWKAWIGRASRNSWANIRGCRSLCGPKLTIHSKRGGTFDEIDKGIEEFDWHL